MNPQRSFDLAKSVVLTYNGIVERHELLAEALRLQPEERADLTTELLRSLESDDEALTPKQWQAAWTKEIQRRLRQLKAGKVKLVEGDQAFRHVRKTIRSKRK